jgi:hypothetical protein
MYVLSRQAIASERYTESAHSRVATSQAKVRWECCVYMHATLGGRSFAYVKVKAHACVIEAKV